MEDWRNCYQCNGYWAGRMVAPLILLPSRSAWMSDLSMLKVYPDINVEICLSLFSWKELKLHNAHIVQWAILGLVYILLYTRDVCRSAEYTLFYQKWWSEESWDALIFRSFGWHYHFWRKTFTRCTKNVIVSTHHQGLRVSDLPPTGQKLMTFSLSDCF